MKSAQPWRSTDEALRASDVALARAAQYEASAAKMAVDGNIAMAESMQRVAAAYRACALTYKAQAELLHEA